MVRVGPNVYRGDYTPLHLAVLDRHAPSVAELLAAGAHPNSEVLGTGFTALDLAVSEGATELIPILVRAGGRPSMSAWRYRNQPDLREVVALLDEELERNRAVQVAEELALTPWRIEEARRLIELGSFEEAQSVLEPVRARDTEESLHMRIRTLIAAGHRREAMEEAACVFALYRDEGRYRQALMVAREMRKICPGSPRPYELELRFLVSLGCAEEAARCQAALMGLFEGRERAACERRFQLLLRAEGNIPKPRTVTEITPSAWDGPAWFTPGANLPAPAAPSMEEWELRFLGGRRSLPWPGLRGEAAWSRYEALRGDLVLNVWEEYAPVALRMRPGRADLGPGTYVYPDDQSWSLVVTRDGDVVLIEL